MTTRNEPAFPGTEANGLNNGMPGMTLRDYFAAKAMQSMLTSDKIMAVVAQTAREGDCDAWLVAAHTAYNVADAMLLAREQS